MFSGFQKQQFRANGVGINAVVGGSGPGLLLLHGNPQTHVIWHKIADRLAKHFTVVATDLRGYGDSSKPEGLADHSNYSKRALAQDQVDVMRELGFERFFLVGHDRGGRVGHRLAVDHPERVEKFVALDIIPTLAMLEQTNMDFARAYFHIFLQIQPAPFPEALIGADPEYYLKATMGRRRAGLAPFTPDALAEYIRCFKNPETIHAICEEYRASASIDLEHDRTDREAGRKIACEALALWAEYGAMERYFEPLEEWRRVARHVTGHSLPCDHYIPEEVPELLLPELLSFLGA